MSYDNFGPPPQHGHGHDQQFFDEPLIQFDVPAGHNDHIRPVKTKGHKNNVGGLNNQGINNPSSINNFANTNTLNKRPEPVEIQFRGYVLRKAEPDRAGEEPSWAKVTQNVMSGSNAELAEQSKKVRQETKTDRLTAYSTLSREQHGVVERIIDKLQSEERVKNAVWVLDSVKKTSKVKQISLLRAEKSTSKIQVIVKRQDKNALKPGQKPITSSQNAQYSGDIIDLSVPAPKKKPEVSQSQLNNNNLNQATAKIGKAAKNQQREQQQFLPPQQFRDDFQMGPPPPPPPPMQQHHFDDPFMPQGNHMMAGGLPDPFANVGQGPPFVEIIPDRRPPHGNQQHNQMPPPPPQFPPHNVPPHAPPPPGAIPIPVHDEWERHQPMQGNHNQHRQNHHSRPPTLRGEFDDNPFRPNDDVFTPGGYDLPLDIQNGRFDRSRPRARSFTPGPRYSSRDPSQDRIRDRSYDDDRDRMNLSRRNSRQEKRSSPTNKKLERKITNLDDRMEEVINKIDDWRIQDVNRDRERERERDRDREVRGRHRIRDQAHYGSSPSSSNSSDYDHNNPWISAPASGGSWTPPSTPPLEYGTLARRKSHRRTSYHPRDSAQLIVEGPPRHRRRQSDILPPALRRDPRPILHHAPTWNGNGPDYPPYPAAERPIRIRGEFDEYERDRGYVEYAGGRPKYEGGRRRRDSMFVDAGRWDDRGERVMFVEDGGRRGRRSAYIN